jgi:hypothetical protein
MEYNSKFDENRGLLEKLLVTYLIKKFRPHFGTYSIPVIS